MRASVVALVAGLLAPIAHSQPTPPAEIRAEPETQRAVPGNSRSLSRQEDALARRATAVILDRPTPEESARLRPPEKGVPLQVGFGRDVASTAHEAGFRAQLAWEPQADGSQVAAVTFTSTGAAAVRAGLLVVAVPPAASFRFYAPDGDELFEVTGEEIHDTISRNLASAEAGLDARTYWSPVIHGPSVTIEVELPAGTPPEELHLAVPRLSHLVTSIREDFVTQASSTCEIDAMCYQGTWGTEMNSVARMIFTSGGSSYVCTGTLLADRDTSSSIPYFLTANHCISTQSAASSLTTYWFYRTSACNGGVGSYKTLTGGASLLYASSNTDTSFMRLNSVPPAGVTFAGWLISSAPALGTSATAIHHPAGDLLKISFASLQYYATCTPPSGGGFSCSNSTASASTFFGVQWRSGITEPGSSGSALFLDNGHYLIGQLYGGSSACGATGATDFYGRFDVAYNAALSQWLGSGTPQPTTYSLAVSRTGTGSGTVTSSPAGISCGAVCSASFNAGTTVTLSAAPASGSSFGGWSGACSGSGACSVAMNANATVSAMFYNNATTPSAPTNLVAYAGTGRATFKFDPPASNGGSAIVLYTVKCTPGNLTASGNASPLSLTGLQSGTPYSCGVSATNSQNTGPAATVGVTPSSFGSTLSLVAVQSRKTHVAATYVLPIDTAQPVAGAVTVEPRSDTTHRIVFTFNEAISTAGVVTVSGANGLPVGAATLTLADNQVTVSLTGVDDRRVRIAMNGVNSVATVAASVGFLAGDVNGNGSVTAADILKTKGRSGQATSTANFVYDVNRGTTIDAADVAAIEVKAGQSLR